MQLVSPWLYCPMKFTSELSEIIEFENRRNDAKCRVLSLVFISDRPGKG